MSNVFEDKSGQNVPSVSFPIINNGEWTKRTTDEIFSNKTVVVFSLPGAFTPTCSSSHLPRYNELAPVFFDNGVDEIVCISVNDTFVMNAWSEDQDAENISVLPDGTGEFTNKMGLLVDKSEIGFGKRSWRYSMLVKNGVVQKMFIEPDLPGDPFEVSDADTMLNHINPEAKSKDIVVISKLDCPFCKKAKATLNEKGLTFEELVVGTDITAAGLRAVSGAETVPQIFIDGEHIGGSEQLDTAL